MQLAPRSQLPAEGRGQIHSHVVAETLNEDPNMIKFKALLFILAATLASILLLESMGRFRNHRASSAANP